MTMRRGVAGARRRGDPLSDRLSRRVLAFDGVRPALAGHGVVRKRPPVLRRATVAVPRPSLAAGWAIRSW